MRGRPPGRGGCGNGSRLRPLPLRIPAAAHHSDFGLLALASPDPRFPRARTIISRVLLRLSWQCLFLPGPR